MSNIDNQREPAGCCGHADGHNMLGCTWTDAEGNRCACKRRALPGRPWEFIDPVPDSVHLDGAE